MEGGHYLNLLVNGGELRVIGQAFHILEKPRVEIGGENRAFKLSFQLRDGDGDRPMNSTRPPPSANSSALIDAKKMIATAFDTSNERVESTP